MVERALNQLGIKRLWLFIDVVQGDDHTLSNEVWLNLNCMCTQVVARGEY